MGSSKVRCLGCGAKNDATAHRCRVCTTIINMYPQEADVAPAPTGPLDDHFDMNNLDRQMRPAKAALGEKGGALAARIAAANAAKADGGGAGATAPSVATAPAPAATSFSPVAAPTERFDPNPGFYDAPAPGAGSSPVYGPSPSPPPTSPAEPVFDSSDAGAIVFETPAPAAATPPPIEYEAERFDPNALFADKKGEGEFF